MMKKILFLTFGLVIMSLSALAQQRINGQWAIKVGGGTYVLSKGYSGTIGMEKIFNPKNSLHIDLKYSDLDFKIKKTDHIFHATNYRLALKYGYNIYSNNIINLQYLIGGYGGYNDVKKHETLVFTEKNELLIGLTTSMQLEFKVARKLNLFLEPVLNYDIKPNYSKLLFLVEVGVKKYF